MPQVERKVGGHPMSRLNLNLALYLCCLGMVSCVSQGNPSTTLPRPQPSSSPQPVSSTIILLPEATATPTPMTSTSTEPIPSATALPEPMTHTPRLATLRFASNTYFLNAAGESLRLEIIALDNQGHKMELSEGLVWASENPTDFDIDQQGRVTARVSYGQTRLSVRHLPTGLRAEAFLIMRGSSSGGGSNGGIMPSAPPLRNCETGQGCVAVAGTGTSGFLGDFGPATEADFDAPHGLAFANGRLYIADAFNHRVRYFENDGVFPLAGSGVRGLSEDNPLAVAQAMNFPQGLTIYDHWVYIADKVNNRVRAVNIQNGEMQTIAGNNSGFLSFPTGLYRVGQSLYIADTLHHRILQANVQSGDITPIAGSLALGDAGDGGPAVEARLHTPHDVAVYGNTLYIADTHNHKIRAVDLDSGQIRTLAGNGVAAYRGDRGLASQASLNYPTEIDIDSQGQIYVVDSQNQVVRMIDSSGYIFTIAKGFSQPYGLALDAVSQKLYVSDTQTHLIQEIALN